MFQGQPSTSDTNDGYFFDEIWVLVLLFTIFICCCGVAFFIWRWRDLQISKENIEEEGFVAIPAQNSRACKLIVLIFDVNP